MSLPSRTAPQRDFSGGQITAKAARRDDLALQRSGLKLSENTRPLASGALAQRFGRSAYNLDAGRTEIIRITDDLSFEFLFGDNALRIRDVDGVLLNEITGLPWMTETIDQIRLAQAERQVVITYPGRRPYLLSYGLSSTPAAGVVSETIGDMTASDAFPVVEGVATSSDTAGGTTQTVTLPSGIQAGELLLILTDSDSSSVSAPPSGWTFVSGQTYSFYKIATGSEGSTVTYTMAGTGAHTLHIARRISGFQGTPEAAAYAAALVNPPSLAPSWGAKKTLFVATAMAIRSGSIDVTGYPANYTDNQSTVKETVGSISVFSSATRDYESASDDPGLFSYSAAPTSAGATTHALRPLDTMLRAFDDVTSKTAAACAKATDDTHAFVGLDFSGDPQRIASITIYGSNNRGFISDTDGTEEGANSTVTLTLRGKNGSAPTSPSDGTSLGTTNFADTANESGGVTITSSDSTTEYDYVFVQIAHNAAADRDILVAQLVISVYSGAAVEQWSFQAFQFTETAQGALRQPYTRYAPKGVTLLPSARTGSGIDVTFSGPVLDASHENVSFRYHGRELVITEITDALTGKANVIETLPPTMRTVCSSAAQRDSFLVGQVAIGETTGAEGYIVAFNSTANLDCIMNKGDSFAASERIITETGVATVSGAPTATTTAASEVWDEAVMSDFRGWPRSVTYDRSRLTFCDFPQIKSAIGWSAIGEIRDMAVGAEAADGFMELAPVGRVLHVVGGADQYVLTDQQIFYIPISEGNPLVPGSVSFRRIASIAASDVQPAPMHEGVVYAASNGKSLIGIIPTGQTSFPYRAVNISEFHADLFTGIRTLAAMTGGGTEAEQYLWVAQEDGTGLVGKFDTANEWVGFVPVTGDGAIKWITALGGDVRFNVSYSGATSWTMETLDEAVYLDCAVPLNTAEPSLRPTPDLGEGRLWFLAGLTVDLMDGTEWLGARAVDSNGDIVEEVGDDFSATTVMAGFGWTVQVSPYIPNEGEGPERGQRVRRRRVKRGAVHVQGATKFTFMGRNFSGAAPIDGTFRAHGQGRSFAPDMLLVKSVPGPITITELDSETTT